MIKIIPITSYPFHTVQNQYFQWNNGIPSQVDFYQLISGITTQNYLNYAPQIYNSQVGSNNFTIKLSKSSFGEDIFTSSILNLNKISLLIFYNDIDNKYYYYYVNDVKQINKEVYEFNLSIDVIQTYFNEIILFKNVKPIRYFPKVNEYFNNSHYVDNALPYGNEPTKKNYLIHYSPLKIGNPCYTFSGIWSYFYFSFSSGDDMTSKNNSSFRGENYYIIAYPKISTNSISGINYFGNNFYNILKNSPYLLKIVDSDIPPFYFYGEISNKITYWNLHYEMRSLNMYKETLSSDYEYSRPEYIPSQNNINNFNFYENFDYLKLMPIKLYDPSQTDPQYQYKQNPFLPKSLCDLFQYFTDYYNGDLFLITDNNPNVIKRNDYLYKLDHISNIGHFNISLDTLIEEGIFKINLTDLKNEISLNGENATLLNNYFSKKTIGYINNEKLTIDNRLIYNNVNDTLEFYFTSYIIHSLENTKEVISYKNIEDREIQITRASELRGTKITDKFQDYIYQNQNTLSLKEKQLKKYNYIDTFASSGLSLASALAVSSIASGGVALGVGVATLGYNIVKNVHNNLMQERQHNATMEDMKLQPLSYEVGNYNSNDSVISYLPIFSIYENNLTEVFKNQISNDTRILNIIKWYGYYTPNTYKNLYKDLFNRKYYNFIQIENENLTFYSGFNIIPNQHKKLIIEILTSGIGWFTPNFITQYQTLKNSEN